MSSLTFAGTVLKTEQGTYQAGDVIRSVGAAHAWSDCLILGFSKPEESFSGIVFVKLARPYAYASAIGTTGPGVLMGCEEFIIEVSKLRFETVVSTNPMVMGIAPRPLDRGYADEVIDLTSK